MWPSSYGVRQRPRRSGFNPRSKTQKIMWYRSRVKWSKLGKGVAPSPTPWCSSYWKGSLQVTLGYGHQLYFTYIYTDIVFIFFYHISPVFIQFFFPFFPPSFLFMHTNKLSFFIILIYFVCSFPFLFSFCLNLILIYSFFLIPNFKIFMCFIWMFEFLNIMKIWINI